MVGRTSSRSAIAASNSQPASDDGQRLGHDVAVGHEFVIAMLREGRPNEWISRIVPVEQRDERAGIHEHPGHQSASPAISSCLLDRSPVPEWKRPDDASSRP